MNKSEVEKREEQTVYGLEQFQKMVLGFMPAGHVIEGFLNYRDGLKQKRILDFSESLKSIFERELGKKLDTYNFETEDFVDVFDSVISQIQNTRSNKKLNGFQAILVNNIRGKSDLVQTFIDLISRLNDMEIDILNKYNRTEDSRKEIVEEIYHLHNLLKEKKVHTLNLKDKANQGTIKPSESIAAGIKDERSVEAKLIRKKNHYKESYENMNGNSFGVSLGEYEYYSNNLMSYGLIRSIKVDPCEDGNELDFILVSDFGKDFLNFITL